MARGLCIVLLMAVAVVCVNGQGIIPGIRNICFEPAKTGVCRAFIPAFYFDPLSGACDCFIYGGCRGNNNRFGTLDECMSTCSVRSELQFNTPSCNRIFGDINPLASFTLSPHKPANAAEPRQPPSPAPTQPQQPTGVALPPGSSSPTPQETETQTEQQPAPQPQEPATQTNSEDESSLSSGSNPLGSKSIASLVIGPSGVRSGTITIGQPVFISFNNPTQENSNEPQQRTRSNPTQQTNDEEQEE